MQIILATKNPGKIKEFLHLFQGLDANTQVLSLESFPRMQDIPEPGSTFEENALYKAKYVCEKTGITALADDSGLEVKALNWGPGVFSARYSGKNATDALNNEKLLQELKDVAQADRTARFRCVLALWTPNGEHLLAKGKWEGYITEQPKGKNGFGYDPLFFDPNVGLTAAQMSSDQKNKISHRAQALQDFLQKWPGFLERIQLEN